VCGDRVNPLESVADLKCVGAAYVGHLGVFDKEQVLAVLASKSLKSSDEVIADTTSKEQVDVELEGAAEGRDELSDAEQLLRRVEVNGDAKVALLTLHDAHHTSAQRVLRSQELSEGKRERGGSARDDRGAEAAEAEEGREGNTLLCHRLLTLIIFIAENEALHSRHIESFLLKDTQRLKLMMNHTLE